MTPQERASLLQRLLEAWTEEVLKLGKGSRAWGMPMLFMRSADGQLFG